MDWNLIGKKIAQLRTQLTLSQAAFGQRVGTPTRTKVTQATVSRWEGGSPVQEKFRPAIATLAGMQVQEFFHTKKEPRLIPVIGFVVRGETFVPVDDVPAKVDIEHIEIDLGQDENTIAVRVRGDSMRPAYRDGDVIFASRLCKRDLSLAIGEDCIVKTKAGEGLVKVVHKGSKRNRFTLRSHKPAYQDIEDVELEWAAPVRWVKRRSRN